MYRSPQLECAGAVSPGVWKNMRRPVHRTIALVFLLSTSSTLPPGRCARTTASQINNDTSDDYDIHIPLSAIPLGVNIGPSLEVLSFAKDAKTGELPWVARRGWLEVGDVLVSLVSLEGEYMSEFSPGEYAEAMQKILESKQTKPGQLRPDGEDSAGEFITLRVRPGRRPGRATRNYGMYSPMTKEEADQKQASWYLSYSTGPLPSGKVDVTLAAFGSEPDGCDALPVVMAIPEDGCLPLRNAKEVEGAHVLVRRGGCSFLAKALTVGNSGGRSLVVVDEGAGRLRMEADQGEVVGIPVVMVSKQDGKSLTNMAASTSRATGKVTASLVVTSACLPKRVEPPHPPPSRRTSSQLERRGRRLSSTGASPAPTRLKAPNADSEVPIVEAVRAAGVGTGRTETKLTEDKAGAGKPSDAPQSGQGTRGKGRGPAAAEAAVARAAGEARRGEVQHAMPPRCRGRSSGQLRGGDLILSSTAGSGSSHVSVEFLSTFVAGSLSIQRLEVTSTNIPDDPSPGNDPPALVVTIPSGACIKLVQKHEEEAPRITATTNGARTVMLLPPDADCSVERQIRLGEQLGSAMLVVIADATDDANITHLVSSTTDIIFTGSDASGDTPSPAYNKPLTSRAPPPALGRSQRAERTGGNPASDDGPEKEPLNGDVELPGSVDQRQRLQKTGGGDNEGRGRSRGGRKGDANCPPLTVVVGHDEGKRVLEWLQTAGGGAVTASVAEREDVGKLWGDVVWASDPANWPKGLKKRRRILNRLRKTHSPAHAGRGGDEDGAARRKASATRWSLIESYAKASEEAEDIRPSTPIDGRLDTEL